MYDQSQAIKKSKLDKNQIKGGQQQNQAPQTSTNVPNKVVVNGPINTIKDIYHKINPNGQRHRNFQQKINQWVKQKKQSITNQMRDNLIKFHNENYPFERLDFKSGINNNNNNNNNNSNIFTKGYIVGDFSKFAHKVQQQMNQKDKLIDTIIKQAVVSFEKSIKQNVNQIKQFLKLNETQRDILRLFNNQTEIRQFLNDPISFTIKQIYNDKNPSLDTHLRLFFERRIILRKSAQIDGKFINILRLKLHQRFYDNKHLFIPVQNTNVYVKLKQGSITKVIFKQGKFFEERQISFLGEKAKEEIMGMVLLYLKSKDIVIEEPKMMDVVEKISTLVQNVKKSSPPSSSNPPGQK